MEGPIDEIDGCRQQDCLQQAETQQTSTAQQQIPKATHQACHVVVEVQRHSLRMAENVLIEGIGESHISMVYALQTQQHSVEKAY